MTTTSTRAPARAARRTPADKYDERRTQLAISALATLGELGYARTSLREIAQNSEFSHGVVHYYFTDKFELITHCVRYYKAQCVTRYDDLVAESVTADELLDRFAAKLVETMTDEAPMHRLWYDLRTQAMFEDQFRPDVLMIDATLQEMIGRVVSQVRRAGRPPAGDGRADHLRPARRGLREGAAGSPHPRRGRRLAPARTCPRPAPPPPGMTPSIGDWLSQSSSEPGEVAGRYDDWATSYDADLSSWAYQAPAVVAGTVLGRVPRTGAVLDVGCGTGLVGRELRARGFEGRLIGLDLSQASLDIARESGGYDSLERADLQQPLALEDDSVDAVVCVGVMTYLPDVEAVWREFARLARPSGIVVATQREDLWHDRECQAVVDRLEDDGVLRSAEVTGPAPYLPQGYGGTPAVACYYLTATVA